MSPFLSRRDFIKATAGTVAAAGFRPELMAETQMLTKKIPSSGEAIPVIAIGSFKTFDVTSPAEIDEVRNILKMFYDNGGRLVDSSPMYGNAESVIGETAEALKLNRSFLMATKVWTTGCQQGIEQMNRSFARMKTEKMFLMQVHNLLDVDTHLRTLRDWKKAGRVKYIGVTHYTEGAYQQVERELERGGLDFLQINYSLAEREAEKRVLPAAKANGVAVIVNRPFAQGALISKVRGKEVPDWAKQQGIASWGQFFLKFIVSHPAVTCAIPATRNPKHLSDNMGAGVGDLLEEKTRLKMAAEVGL